MSHEASIQCANEAASHYLRPWEIHKCVCTKLWGVQECVLKPEFREPEDNMMGPCSRCRCIVHRTMLGDCYKC